MESNADAMEVDISVFNFSFIMWNFINYNCIFKAGVLQLFTLNVHIHYVIVFLAFSKLIEYPIKCLIVENYFLGLPLPILVSCLW